MCQALAVNWKGAATAFQHAIELDSKNSDYHQNLALVLFRQRDFAAAEASYRAAIELKSDNAEYHSRLGIVLGLQDNWKEAEADFRRALELTADSPRYPANLAGALFRLGHRDKALPLARQANQRGLKRHWVYIELGLE